MSDELPSAVSEFTRVLVAVMRSRPARAPVAEVTALLAQPLSADLRAFLHAWAHHSAGFLEVGDWDLDRKPHLTSEARLRGDASAAIVVGMTGGGDVFVARLGNGSETVARVAHDSDEEELYESFEDLVCDRVFDAQARERPTDLDQALLDAGIEPL